MNSPRLDRKVGYMSNVTNLKPICLSDSALDKISKDELVQQSQNLFGKCFLLSQECDNLREGLAEKN